VVGGHTDPTEEENDLMSTSTGKAIFGLATSVAVMAWLLLPCGTYGGDFVVNGDFETGADLFVVWPGYTGDGSPGANPAEIPAWPAPPESGGRGINPVVPGGEGDAPFRDNGDNDTSVAFLQGTAAIEQQMSGFTVGQDYVLSLDFNSRNCCGDFPIATIALNDIVVGSSTDLFPAPGAIPAVGDDNPWYHADIEFTAPETDITLSITAAPAAGGDATLLVDNVSVVAGVPEPVTGLLALLGIVMIAVWLRRK
jgi:hypothetical protein